MRPIIAIVKFTINLNWALAMSDSDGGETGLDLSFGRTSEPGKWISLMHENTPSGNDSDDDYAALPARPRSPKTHYAEGNTSPRGDDLKAGPAMTAIFALVSDFHAEVVEIPVHWKPFIPNLMPAIGTIDAFIKIPSPDAGELLGLTILDEPSIAQSNPQILRMELREQYGLNAPGKEADGYIGSIEDPRKSPKALTAWLDSLEDLHRKRPPPTMRYSSTMPELETLMENWPDAMEQALMSLLLPNGDLDLTFDEFCTVVCSILEIPVRGNLVESLHCLFSLYMQFESNHYFH
jgi:intraflagellar transport protein 46